MGRMPDGGVIAERKRVYLLHASRSGPWDRALGMDTALAVIGLRFVERICAVLIGGLSIYLGCRLFLKIPGRADAEGKFILPWNITVVLSRIGPGVFFALFGAVLVGVSFFKPIDFDERWRSLSSYPASGDRPVTLDEHSTKFAGLGTQLDGNRSGTLNDARALLRREIALLNRLPGEVKQDLPPHERNDIEAGLRRVKFALMRSVWDSVAWGPAADFENWVNSREPAVEARLNKAALDYFHYDGNDKP